MRKNQALRIASVCGMVAVTAGAFGAHALKKVLDAAALTTWDTAVKYQFLHSLVILAIAFYPQPVLSGALKRAVWFFLTGILMFSGSLYILSFHDFIHLPWLGPVTPLGGMAFIGGWICLLIQSFKPSGPTPGIQ